MIGSTNRSDQSLVAEYAYNGLNHRISWHYDVDADTDVDVNDETFYWVYSDRWQLMATYREDDTDPKEQFLYHAAGLAGRGGSSYIDLVVLRDDHDADWDAAADDTLERRVYYCQNWRADVIALLAHNGRVLERVWYEPYGTPHGSPPADWTTGSNSANDDYGVLDGDFDSDDYAYFNTLFAASDARADLTASSTSTDFGYGRPDGTVDSDDNFYYLDLAAAAEGLGRGVLSGSASSDSLRNRKGLAGYEWDPSTSKYHVRNRVLDPETGRWTRRDPLGYVDGENLYQYAASHPNARVDPLGLDSISDCAKRRFDSIIANTSAGLGCRITLLDSLEDCCSDLVFYRQRPSKFNFNKCVNDAKKAHKKCSTPTTPPPPPPPTLPKKIVGPPGPNTRPPDCFDGCQNADLASCILCVRRQCDSNTWNMVDEWCASPFYIPLGPRIVRPRGAANIAND